MKIEVTLTYKVTLDVGYDKLTIPRVRKIRKVLTESIADNVKNDLPIMINSKDAKTLMVCSVEKVG